MTIGNHEWISDNSMEHYSKRFYMPNYKATKNMWYSFDINNVHVVSLNSEIFNLNRTTEIDALVTWVNNDVQKSLDKRWKIAFLHHPMYCSKVSDDGRCDGKAVTIRNKLETILKDNKFDLIIAGHVHSYERGYPVYKEEVDTDSYSLDPNVYTNPKYPVHMVCGAAGANEGIGSDCKNC
jgi:hypothetical protein